jgi:hypothetical protein
MSNLTSCASWILADLVDEPAEEVQFNHDAEGEEFPEVAEAIKDAGGSENAMTVAICHSQGLWGVGCGGTWKKRETIAKLALCVALVQVSDKADHIFEQFPDFADYCSELGMPGARKKQKPVPKVKAKAKAVVKKPVAPLRPPPAVLATPKIMDVGLPRDVPVWIRLPDDEPLPDKLDGGYPAEAVVVTTDGTKRKGLYSSADKVLCDLVGDVEAEIEFHDDCDWKEFPTVGAALKQQIADKEECLCVATCPSKMIWAVGVCMKGKPRWQAAKVAIATAIVMQANTMGEAVELDEGTAFAEFAQEATDSMNSSGLF